MSKTLNKRGKFARADKDADRSKHWKYGKSSGNGTFQEKKADKKKKREKK